MGLTHALPRSTKTWVAGRERWSRGILEQWGSVWLANSILMRGQDPRRNTICSVLADKVTRGVTNGSKRTGKMGISSVIQVCLEPKTRCPYPSPLTLKMTQVKFESRPGMKEMLEENWVGFYKIKRCIFFFLAYLSL